MIIEGVSVIIPNWNGARRLLALFKSLAGQRPIHEVLVVDNGSTDCSVELAQDAGARVISLPANLGFATAVNRGIAAANARWVAVINNDVQLTTGWLETLTEAASTHSASFATGKLLSTRQPDRIDGTFDAVCRGGTAWRCGAGRPDGRLFQGEKSIQFASFTAILIEKAAITQTGPLDEAFESYLEDVDFGFRCAKLGLRGVYVPAAVAYHEGSATLGRWHPETVRRIARNQILLIAKHYPHPWVGQYGWCILLAHGLWGMLALRHGAGVAWLRGVGQGIRSFRARRNPGPATLHTVLLESEAQIREIQRLTGADLYWRIYFALAGTP